MRTEIRTADSSVHGRPVRENADWKETVRQNAAARRAASGAGAIARPQGARLVFDAGALARAGADAAAWVLLFGIRFYQAIFARLMPVGCKFYPSCSRYAAEAIERHGAGRGTRLALARLWRCRPFTQGGFDPVPDADEVSNGARGAAERPRGRADGGERAEVRL